VRMAYTMYFDQRLTIAKICQTLRLPRRRSIGMSPWVDALQRG
jgi:hypothetical protein